MGDEPRKPSKSPRESSGEPSNRSLHTPQASHPSVTSDKKTTDSQSSKSSSKKLSKVSETVTVITKCAQDPDTCVLCGSGISSSKCVNCEREAHNICIEAFFCTTGKKVDFRKWKCPKCVTINNMETENKERPAEKTEGNQVDLDVKKPDYDCPFCKIDMEIKNCRCTECSLSMEGNIRSKSKRCSCSEDCFPSTIQYNKCLLYRDSNFAYKSLEDRRNKCFYSIWCRICWSICWFLLLITFAFPIAWISATIFIIVYCFESCSDCCHPVGCFFLEGIKLPGTCCFGICSGEPMCTYNEAPCDSTSEKYH